MQGEGILYCFLLVSVILTDNMLSHVERKISTSTGIETKSQIGDKPQQPYAKQWYFGHEPLHNVMNR